MKAIEVLLAIPGMSFSPTIRRSLSIMIVQKGYHFCYLFHPIFVVLHWRTLLSDQPWPHIQRFPFSSRDCPVGTVSSFVRWHFCGQASLANLESQLPGSSSRWLVAVILHEPEIHLPAHIDLSRAFQSSLVCPFECFPTIDAVITVAFLPHLFLLPGLGFTSSPFTGCSMTLLGSCCVFR